MHNPKIVYLALLTAIAVFGCVVEGDKDLQQLSRVGSAVRELAGVIEQVGFTETATEGAYNGLSWRGLVCATMPAEEFPGYTAALPWDAPEYAALNREELRRFFRLPGSSGIEADQSDIQAFSGEGTFLAEVKGSGWKSIASMPNDLLILISADPMDLHWMQPSPIEIEACWTNLANGLTALPPPTHTLGRFLCFADGESWLVSNDATDERVCRFATVEGAATYDREAELGKYLLRRFRPAEWK